MKHISEDDSAQLSALLDDTLPAAQAAALRQRLQHDDALQDAFTELALIRDAMRQLPVVLPPRSLRIAPQKLQQSRGWRWWFVMPPAGLLIPNTVLALSVCLCIVLGQQAMQIVNTPETLKGDAMLESMSTNAEVAPASGDAAPRTDNGDLQVAADPLAAPAPSLDVVAPTQPIFPLWWWAASGATAALSIGSGVWAWRLAQRRRVMQKR